MPKKPIPLNEADPELAARWMGNVSSADTRTPESFGSQARLRCWWWCGKSSHERFEASPNDHRFGFSCPTCQTEWRAEYDRVMNLPVADVPSLVAAWTDERPHTALKVRDLCGGVAGQNMGRTFSLRCPNGHKLDTVVRRYLDPGCPWCRGNQTRAIPRPLLRDADPELAATLHPTRNGELTVTSLPDNYRGPLWWKSVQCCGHEWQETIPERTLGRRPQAGRGHFYCPACKSVWGSLAWLDPALASEWHEDNELTPWHVKPFSGGVVVRWRCASDPSHEWEAAVSDRSAGRLCPHCSTAGTSMIEQAFLTAALAVDPNAAATRIGRWRVDVLVPSMRLVIEYDGVYWHSRKQELDTRKTVDLTDAGYRVLRVRENDLAHLDLTAPGLRQVSFQPKFGRVGDVIDAAITWAQSLGPPA